MALTKVKSGGITDATIATEDIAADAITGNQIADDAIDSEHLANGCINNSNFFQGTIVNSAALSSNAVATAKIADGAVTNAKIASGAVGTNKLASGAVGSGEIATGSIVNSNINNSAAISGSKLADDSISLAKLEVSRIGRNVIVNGAMQVAQRGTSFTNIANTGVIGSVDRMMMVGAGLDELAFAGKQTSDGPDGFKKCFEFDVTTAENALGADDLCYIRYKIEGQDLTSFYNANGTGKNFVLSFYVKAYQAGTYQLNIYKPNGGRFISKTYSIASSGVWQRIEVPFTGDTNTSGINDDNGAGLNIAWMLVAGTDYTSAGVLPNWGGWPGNSGFAGGQAVNVASSTNNYFRITGIQLELGDTATDFEHRSFADELLKCQRYYENVKGASYNNSNEVLVANGFNYTTNRVIGSFQFKAEKRARPSTSTDDASEVQVLKSNAGWYSAGSFGGNSNIYCTRLDCTSISTSPLTLGHASEIRLINDGIIHFDAEL